MKAYCTIKATRDYKPGDKGYYAVSAKEPIIHKGDLGAVVDLLNKKEQMYAVEIFDENGTYSVLIDMPVSEMDFVHPEDKDVEWQER